MKEFLGERQILVAKEITKIHENIIKGTLDNILEKVKFYNFLAPRLLPTVTVSRELWILLEWI